MPSTQAAHSPITAYTCVAQAVRHSHQRGADPAVTFGDATRTWAEFTRRIAKLADAFSSRGVGAGDRVLIFLLNRTEYLECILAAHWLGAIAVPVNFRLASEEVRFFLRNSEPSVVVVENYLLEVFAAAQEDDSRLPVLVVGDGSPTASAQERYEDALAAEAGDSVPADVDPSDVALIMYTGGTTGTPKGAMLTHQNIAVQSQALTRALRFNREDDVVLIPSPLFHIAALSVVFPAWMLGLHLVIAPSMAFDPAVQVALMQRHKVTATGMVPTQWQDICRFAEAGKHDLSLRVMSWGASPATPALLRDMARVFPGVPNVATFGQTEMSPLTCVLEGEDALRKLGSVGKPVPTVAARIVDEQMNDVARGEVGEIVYRGPSVMKGYWRNPEATAAAFEGGWFHSGDLVRMDDEGFIWVVDRLKDMIISGGENIYCAEVEAVIADHPGVAEVAVVGVPHEKWIETPIAVVVPKNPDTPPSAEEIVDYCKERLASYKKPNAVVVTPSLQRSAAGKILKGPLRDAYRTMFSQESNADRGRR